MIFFLQNFLPVSNSSYSYTMITETLYDDLRVFLCTSSSTTY